VWRPLPGEVVAAKQRHGEAAAGRSIAATEYHHRKAAAGEGRRRQALPWGGAAPGRCWIVGTPARETQGRRPPSPEVEGRWRHATGGPSLFCSSQCPCAVVRLVNAERLVRPVKPVRQRRSGEGTNQPIK
jgi:hypothetical protein